MRRRKRGDWLATTCDALVPRLSYSPHIEQTYERITAAHGNACFIERVECAAVEHYAPMPLFSLDAESEDARRRAAYVKHGDNTVLATAS